MTRVIGVGRLDGGDDAVGPRVAMRLRAEGLDAHVAASAAELTALLDVADRAIVVDAVVGAGPAGTVLVLDEGALRRHDGLSVSSHGLGVADALALARAMHACAPDVRVIGVAIDPPRGAASMSAPVACAIDAAAALARDLSRAPSVAGADGADAEGAVERAVAHEPGRERHDPDRA